MAAITFKCPSCGGELLFEPSKQKYVCPYCASEFTQQQLDELTPASAQEHQEEPAQASPVGDLAGAGQAGGSGQDAAAQADGSGQDGAAQAGESWQDSAAPGSAGQGSAVVYSCPSCGAEIVTDETTAATFCYYCHNPVVLEGRLSGDFLPDQVIPFQISRDQAVEKFLQFVGTKKYVPKAFFNKEQIDKMTGVYYPYWVYDTDLSAGIDAEGRKIRVWRMGETEYTETSIYQVERAGTASFRNQTRNALRIANGEWVEKVQPYRLNEAKKFTMGYLSGFQAEKRDMEKKEFSDGLHKETTQYAQRLLKETASGYQSLQVRSSSAVPVKENWRYMLLPVWVLTYRSLAGKMYSYAMNGQTGTVAGELPLDSKKLAIHSLLTGLIVFALVLAGGYFL